MTREQAINSMISHGFTVEQAGEIIKAVTLQEPTTKNDLGVDCISRAEAVRVASGYCHPSNIAKELAKLPSVTPQEPKTGHWIDTNDNGFVYHRIYKCSHCGATVCEYPENIKKHKYCFNCDAKMVEPQESEDKK